jgi:single-stranded-DNA-specific exonuclease
MARPWKIKTIDAEKTAVLPEYPNLILRLLSLRGITEEQAIHDFLEPEYEKLHDPFLFKDMQKSVERINAAITNQEPVAIYADYDADAITACSVLYLALKKLGIQAEYYIPDRFTEGYGINQDAIRKLAERGIKLVMTVDCGINAVEEAELCKQLGIDLIITDHHELTGKLPDAFAIINPKNPTDNYPFQFLTGVGVAYKLVQALFSKISNDQLQIPNGYEKWLLDLVAIGTVADCQSLTGENRIMVSYGLKVLAKTKWLGLKALLEAAAVKTDKYDSFTLGFVLAPRINAAGRIKHADAAFKLLVADNPAEAAALAQDLNDLNKHRQALTEQVLSEAKEQVELGSDKKIIVVHGLNWPKGIVGLIAGRLTEQYNRPTLAISVDDEGIATGSARSTPDFDIVSALGFAKDYLLRYGGHTQAAGFTLEKKHLEGLHGKLLEYAESLNLTLSEASLTLDAELEPSDITWENIELVEKLAPFGIGNPKPKFCAYGFTVLESRFVGTTQQHLKLKLGLGELQLEAIAFNQGFLASQIVLGDKIDAAFELGSNEWNGRKDMQLKILDIKLRDK